MIFKTKSEFSELYTYVEINISNPICIDSNQFHFPSKSALKNYVNISFTAFNEVRIVSCFRVPINVTYGFFRNCVDYAWKATTTHGI